jgi:hypothetical protein
VWDDLTGSDSIDKEGTVYKLKQRINRELVVLLEDGD